MASLDIEKRLEDIRGITQSATVSWVGTSLRRTRLNKALAELNATESNCHTQSDLGHCKSYRIILESILIKDLCSNDLIKQDLQHVHHHLSEVCSTWSWLFDHPQFQFSDCPEELRALLGHLLTSKTGSISKEDFLYSVKKSMNHIARTCKDPFLTAYRHEITYLILEFSFHKAIRLFEKGEWAPAKNIIKSREAELDVLVEFEEKHYAGDKPDVFDDFSFWGVESLSPQNRATLLQKDYQMQDAMCKAAQMIHSGDILFNQALQGEPSDLLQNALLAQDDYRAALGYIVGQDVEMEGTALVRLARFHAKVAMLPVVAHQLYLRGIQLAAALQPSLPKGEWYKECADAVQAHRDALQAEEAKKWEKAREPILEKLADEIKKLNDAKNMSNMKFAEFVFKTWPPKTEGGIEPPSDPNDPNNLSKKQLLKVIQRYHTDKNMGYGDEWRVLSEEIAKALTARYNTMKGM